MKSVSKALKQNHFIASSLNEWRHYNYSNADQTVIYFQVKVQQYQDQQY